MLYFVVYFITYQARKNMTDLDLLAIQAQMSFCFAFQL